MLSSSAKKVQDALDAFGIQLKVVELPDSTRSAVEAAQAIGCNVGQIAKSLIFRTTQTNRPVLVIASGPNRVDEKKIGMLVGESIGKPDADYVRQHTGFGIGGVPPLGHVESIQAFIDEDLLQYTEIWAAAGTPHAVFRITPEELVKVTGGEMVSVK
jgi:prolyl-tRNA editing enzyme YbaK/EbsC (Cys-tRNA(Pro) deacylase)